MITYNAIDIEQPQIVPAATTAWLRCVAKNYGKRIGDIAYVFVSDEEILRINREFIGHDYYTDHIGFDRSAHDILSGDIYISLDTVRTNAELFGRPYEEELHRVIAHGLLHLCGITDKTPDERLVMEDAENRALALLTT
ncbi:MAG: rRNA maturation RNase YbeY [Bacteroidaceae bacterium]|nr:rRNA maturation RNase YbeY [Bacteroidaceae bacterium]